MDREALLNEYFLEARHHLLELAAFMDRVERAGGGQGDFRWESLREAIRGLSTGEPDSTRRMLELLSDPTEAPVDSAPQKGATGAWPEFRGKAS